MTKVETKRYSVKQLRELWLDFTDKHPSNNGFWSVSEFFKQLESK